MKKALTNGIGLKKKDRLEKQVTDHKLGQIGVKTPEAVMLTMEDMRGQDKCWYDGVNYDDLTINGKFMNAVWMGDKGYNVAKSLLEKGADVEYQYSDMNGSFHPILCTLDMAASGDRTPTLHMLELLLQNGANGYMNMERLIGSDDPDETIVDYAYDLGLIDHVKLFKKYGFKARGGEGID